MPSQPIASDVMGVALFLLLCACGDTSGPPAPASVRATGGEGQIGPVHSLLPDPVVATVLDASGQPVAGVEVTWSAEGDGRMTAVTHTTDAQGQARARWVLGGVEGVSRATAAVAQLEPATFTAIAEAPGQMPFGEVHVLDLQTYEGSKQVVHPDYARVPDGVTQAGHHLAITPYPFGDAAHENPSHFIGERLDRFALPPGAPNPVIRPTNGHLSDPDMLYVEGTGELWLYYRQVTADNIILLTRTADGIRWSPPVEVARAPNHQVVSQTIVRRGDGDWWMWAVNAGSLGCGAPYTAIEVRRSSDGIHWSEPEGVGLEQQGLYPWHLEVQWIPSRNEFWALYNVKRGGDCATPALYLATSPDGHTWTVQPAPVLTRGRIPELYDIVYRSSFAYDAATDAVIFWYSGARHNGTKYIWGAAVERRRRAEVFGEDAAAVRAGPLDWGEPPARLYDGP
ncbi:MAG TPA: Ig-like domain-containing protein [Phycisphaerales bacterium]|nr:Ig-like domain-containing protein [Phycisphaerales bacterium]